MRTALELTALALILAACAYIEALPVSLPLVAAAAALEGAACLVGRGRA